MKRYLLYIFIVLPSMLAAQTIVPGNDVPECDAPGQDDMGMWIEVGATKKLNRHWSVGAEMEMRMNDNFSNVNRFMADVSATVRPLQWLKFGTGYSWVYNQSPCKVKNHYKDDIEDDEHWNGYNATHSYWSVKQRLRVGMALETPKLWRCIRLSARERYQFTWRNPQDVDRTKYRYTRHDVDEDWNPVEPYYTLKGEPENDLNHKEYESSSLLRSRFKVEYDKKRCRWSPFVSYEFVNDLTDGMTLLKTRLIVGTGYKISRNHELSLSYIFNTEYDDVTERMHVLGIGYEYKF